MDEPIFLGFVVLELSKFLDYQTNYDKIRPYFSGEPLQLLFIDCDSFLLSIRTHKYF